MGAHLDNLTSIQNCSFLMKKRGLYYFRRSVPVDLIHYFDKQRICIALRTRDKRVAKARAQQMSNQLQQEFEHLRWRDSPVTFSKYIGQSMYPDAKSDSVLLSAACDLYADIKGRDKPKTFHQSLNRAVRYLVACCGDKPIDTYTREDANNYRDDLSKRGLSGNSVAKSISVIRAMLNFVCREKGYDQIQTFSSVYVADAEPSSKRVPIPVDVIRSVQHECRAVDDELRWIISLISDTGMRLSEALGLSVQDVDLTADIPNLTVREHSWRRLKTASSTRTIPLVGESLWAVQRAIASTNTDRLFPKYCVGGTTKSNSVSGACNKWLKARLPNGAVVHSYRHSMRDRLRNVECPTEIAHAVGGWASKGVGEKYGSGYGLEVLHKYMKMIVLR